MDEPLIVKGQKEANRAEELQLQGLYLKSCAAHELAADYFEQVIKQQVGLSSEARHSLQMVVESHRMRANELSDWCNKHPSLAQAEVDENEQAAEEVGAEVAAAAAVATPSLSSSSSLVAAPTAISVASKATASDDIDDRSDLSRTGYLAIEDLLHSSNSLSPPLDVSAAAVTQHALAVYLSDLNQQFSDAVVNGFEGLLAKFKAPTRTTTTTTTTTATTATTMADDVISSSLTTTSASNLEEFIVVEDYEGSEKVDERQVVARLRAENEALRRDNARLRRLLADQDESMKSMILFQSQLREQAESIRITRSQLLAASMASTMQLPSRARRASPSSSPFSRAVGIIYNTGINNNANNNSNNSNNVALSNNVNSTATQRGAMTPPPRPSSSTAALGGSGKQRQRKLFTASADDFVKNK